MSVIKCTDSQKQGVERISHQSMITPSTKVKSQAILGAEMCQALLLSFRSTGFIWFQKAFHFGFLLPELGQGGCPIVHWGHLKASFAGLGCSYHPFSSPAHSLLCRSSWFTSLNTRAHSSPLSPTTIFTWGTHITACLGQTLESGYWHLRKDSL